MYAKVKLFASKIITVCLMLMLAYGCDVRAAKGTSVEIASLRAQEFFAKHGRLPTEQELVDQLLAEPNLHWDKSDTVRIFWEKDGEKTQAGFKKLTTVVKTSSGEEIQITELVDVRK